MNELKTALIIEDNEDIVQTVSLAFRIRWQGVNICSTPNGQKGIILVEEKNPNVVILDLGLPDIDGFRVIQEIRQFSKVPIIVLTVRDAEADVVRALELGADDYVLKPFRQLELTSRVNSQLRHGEIEEEIIQIGKYYLNLSERILSIDKKNISLTRIETIIMKTLFRRVGHVVSHALLAEQIWCDAHPSTVKNVRIHIKRLRTKLEGEAGLASFIVTKPGVGYLVQV